MNDKITPPPLLERAVTQAIIEADLSGAESAEVTAEALLYSEPMQSWMHGELARLEALTARQEHLDDDLLEETVRRTPEEPVTVQCSVTIPADGPVSAAAGLGRVPINANLAWTGPTFATGNILATWTEER